MTKTDGLLGEMIAQAKLGHEKFCVGYHDHGPAGVEEDWIEWRDAVILLASQPVPSASEAVTDEGTRVTDEEVQGALKEIRSGWGWLAMPDSMRQDYIDAFALIYSRRTLPAGRKASDG